MPPDAPASTESADFRTLKRFLPYLWPRDDPGLKLRIVIAMALVLLSKAIQLSMGFLYAGAIDRMAPGMQAAAGLAIALVVAYAGARFAGVLFDNLRNTVFERVGQDATRKLAEHVFAHLHRLSMRFHMNRRTGAVAKVIERGTKSIDVMLYFLLFNIAPTVIELAAVAIIFWTKFGVELVLATAVMVAAYILFTQKVTDWRNALREEMNDLDTATVARSIDSLLNYETVKYFSAEDRETVYYARVARRYADAAVKSENSLAWLNIGQSLITNLLMAGAMAYSVWGWSQGRFTTGDVVLVNTLLAQLFRPLDLLGMVYRTIRQGLVDMAAMFDLIDTPAEVRDAPNAPPLAVRGGTISFDHVRFGYDPDRVILHDLSFTVPAGGTLAIVGPSGAGKSTLARLLFRFYDVTGGSIRIDGQDIRTITQASLRAAIGIVPQDTVLFNDTIGYNIGYGRDGATQADIVGAAQGAAIHDFIAALPRGYESMVGERGLKLSGGEKQRVAIARTLLKDPPILILDEATSALDSRTEADIQSTLRAVAQRRTTLIIAHRLSTIADADQILVLDAGRVVESGTHADLLKAAGLYAEMWTRQAAEDVA
ncbi:ABCB family ABC transporter ATP-binding protein/permease [Sandaracinobacteroides saxicola]|uniref:ABC transporter ATP-binding protein/permease n=1 Tax=Sandaracinobacteroides saxicola TaxID=2759707 RepID=A0A7G5IEI0_9SPHN|nr:ABC transporter ATP-binding protein/permease [Sandaracinobacteroides saxicola]QMW21772.1 ABC transporter ATP-binding protein/permease [Sandaracinobacteroides saxicola]